MRRQEVISSNLRSVGYDTESNILEIEFNSGGVYQYLNVPESVYKKLMSADSLGRFFIQNIKNMYDFRRV